MKSYLPIVPY
jgi:hypothetical protein